MNPTKKDTRRFSIKEVFYDKADPIELQVQMSRAFLNPGFKTYRSNETVQAARILTIKEPGHSVEFPDTYVIGTENGVVLVSPTWIKDFKPERGGYVLTSECGFFTYLSYRSQAYFEKNYTLIKGTSEI